MILRDWAVITNQNPYKAPEAVTARVSGKVYGNPRFKEGERIVLGLLESISSDGRFVTTESGEKYFLDGPNKEYIAFIRKYYPDSRWDGESLTVAITDSAAGHDAPGE